MRPYLVTGLAAVVLSMSGCADANSAEQSTAPASTITTPTTLESSAANWNIVADASHIRFSALQEGEPFSGEFAEFSGVIRFDPQIPETGVVEITIPLGGIDAGSRDRNSTLPGKVWFSTKAFPDARFTSNDMSKTDAGFLAKGELTLKGMSAPVDLPFELAVENDLAVMTATVEIDRTIWNVGAAPWDTDEWVSRVVNLDIKVTAERSN